MSTTKIVFSGFGGQGILTLGQIVADIAMNKGKEVTWMPSYGAEMRGGTANCSVIISDKIIGSPIVNKNIDILCAMNSPSITKFLGGMRPQGQVYVNTSIVTEKIDNETYGLDLDIVEIDATNIAAKAGNIRVANMVMLAGFLRKTNLFTLEDIERSMEKRFKARGAHLIPLNLQAIEQGLESIEK